MQRICSPVISCSWLHAAPFRLIPDLVLIDCNACCRFESWVGQESKLLAAGYISTKAGGPKEAFFDKEAQDKIGKVQEVMHMSPGMQSCH